MAEKVTIMVIKVDLQCPRCYKKIKKVLCQFHQIRDQIYDEKNNTVTITVVCCSPEKIKQKICCKGGKSIKSIEIKEPPKPKKEPQKPEPQEKPKETGEEKPEEPKSEKPEEQKNHEDSKPVDSPPPPPVFGRPMCCTECSEGHFGGPCFRGPCYEVGMLMCFTECHKVGRPVCCRECSEGSPGGPCFRDQGRPSLPCYEGYRRPVYDSWGGGCHLGYSASHGVYFCEENPSSCTIM